MENTVQRKTYFYRVMHAIARMIFPSATTTYTEPPDDHPAVFVCNHAAMCGPVMMTLYFDRPHKTWAIHCALDRSLSVRYAYHDVFFGNSRHVKWFWRILSKLVGRAVPTLLNQSGTIPVYHDHRIVKTLRDSLTALTSGEDLVIFAESPQCFSPYVNELQPGFADLGRSYFRRTGECLRFYPVYLEKNHRLISVGCPIAYDPTEQPDEQRMKVSAYLRDEIDRLGRSAPKHDPVPFLPPRWYAAYGMYEHDFQKYWEMIEQECVV